MTSKTNNQKLSREEKRVLIKLRRNFHKPVIGVTGNLGKSTLIEMLAAVLSTKGSVLRTPMGRGLWDVNLKTLHKLDSKYDFATFCLVFSSNVFIL